MTTGIDGLVSGLKTTDLINSLMSVEAVPQILLKNKASATSNMVTALQALNAQIASLATRAADVAKPTSLQLYTANSSSTALTATAATGAGSGSIDLVVGKLAQAQVGVTAAMPAWPADPAVLTIVSGTGSPIEIFPVSSSLDDIVDAVNHAGAGVTALKVSSGSIAGVPQYRVQFSSTATGAAAAFNVYQGAAADISPANDLLAQPGSAVIRPAQDAEVTLWAGTTAAQTITSASNTFDELLPGVSVKVSAASPDPVTLTIARDTAAASKVASDFVDSLNGIFATISVKSAVTNSTTATGAATVSAGIFTGDSNIRDAKDKLLSAASLPVSSISPSEIGISITKSGTLEFDADKFAAALAATPDKVQSILQELGTRVAAAGTTVSDKYTGTLTAKITGQQSLIKNLGNQISDWDSRLSSRRSTLERTYAAMEVQLSNMNAQASSLTGQLAGLPSWSGK